MSHLKYADAKFVFLTDFDGTITLLVSDSCLSFCAVMVLHPCDSLQLPCCCNCSIHMNDRSPTTGLE